MAVFRRILPALLLLILAPIVAEFLLGDFSIRKIGIALALLPMYGGGALLIREVARRSQRGWPAIVLLGVAYSLLEEGFLTQSLFNPNYVGQRLLDYGNIPWLGTSLNWCTLVLSQLTDVASCELSPVAGPLSPRVRARQAARIPTGATPCSREPGT